MVTEIKPKRTISFRASEELYKRLKDIAAEEKKKVSAIIEGHLWDSINSKEMVKEPTIT